MILAAICGAGGEPPGQLNRALNLSLSIGPRPTGDDLFDSLPDEISHGSAGCKGDVPQGGLLLFGQLDLSAYHAFMINTNAFMMAFGLNSTPKPTRKPV
jgi:hypothetical protein